MSNPSPSTLIILASARSHGATRAAVECVIAHHPGARLIDAGKLRIEPYAYQADMRRDDFGVLVDALLCHDQIVVASPVYWYAMSGLLKTVFDRLTDLLDPTQQHLGRALAGRSLFALSTGTDDDPPLGFDQPFARTAAYFAMTWGGLCYVRSSGTQLLDRETTKIETFSARLNPGPTTEKTRSP